jgi:hypothetical protein
MFPVFSVRDSPGMTVLLFKRGFVFAASVHIRSKQGYMHFCGNGILLQIHSPIFRKILLDPSPWVSATRSSLLDP